jgi:hypothetical protein
MPSVDKQSVREAFEKIKDAFRIQVNSGKVAAETASLFNALMTFFSLLIAIFMEKNTKKNSKNPGIHSLSQMKITLHQVTNKTRAKSKLLYKQITAELLKLLIYSQWNIALTVLKLLPKQNASVCKHRTIIDLLFEKQGEYFDAEVKERLSCDATVVADFPDGVAGSRHTSFLSRSRHWPFLVFQPTF